MFSKRELEGYLLIDHRAGEGITPEMAAEAQTKTVQPVIPVPRGMKFETATINCSHCQALVVLNPKRDRSRGYCPKCDHYVCDLCEAERVRTGACRPFKQVMDEYLEQAVKGL
jgi:hypothetical protein